MFELMVAMNGTLSAGNANAGASAWTKTVGNRSLARPTVAMNRRTVPMVRQRPLHVADQTLATSLEHQFVLLYCTDKSKRGWMPR